MKKGNQGDGGGQPPVVFTQEQIDQVGKLAGVLTLAQLSDYFGIAPNTFRAVCDRQPEVLEQYKKAKSDVLAQVGSNLVMQALQGNIPASIFYLKTQGRWSEKQEIDIRSDGVPTQILLKGVEPDGSTDSNSE